MLEGGTGRSCTSAGLSICMDFLADHRTECEQTG